VTPTPLSRYTRCLRRFRQLQRYTRLRPQRPEPRRGTIKDDAYLAFVHQEPCMVHGRNCPRWCGALQNRIEAHHVDHNHRNDRRTVPLCKVAHQFHALPSWEAREKEIKRLNDKYERMHPTCTNEHTGTD
jgi:hypothetical protein